MGKSGRFSVDKYLTGKCEIETVLEPGDEVTWTIEIRNETLENKWVSVADDLPCGLAKAAFTGLATLGEPSGFSAAGELPLADPRVFLPPNSAVCYDIVGVVADDYCGTITNIACIWCHDEKYPRWVGADPITVGEPKVCPDPDAVDTFALMQDFMPNAGNRPQAGWFKDRISKCRTLFDYLHMVEQLAAAAGLKFKDEIGPPVVPIKKEEA